MSALELLVLGQLLLRGSACTLTSTLLGWRPAASCGPEGVADLQLSAFEVLACAALPFG